VPAYTTAVVGRIGRPHGLTGEVTVEVRTDEPDRRFASGTRLTAEGSGRTLTVTGHRWHQGRLLVRFEELPDRTAAEEARDTVLAVRVDGSDRPTGPEEYWDRDLVGLEARAADGTRVGTVTGVMHLPAQDVLEIDAPTGEILVPFVSALVPAVDLAAGTLTLAESVPLTSGPVREQPDA